MYRTPFPSKTRPLLGGWIGHLIHCMTHNDFGGIVPRMEHDVLVVKYSDKSDDGNEEMISGYFEKFRNKWILTGKKVPMCSYCRKNTCDRMTYNHELDTEIMRLSSIDMDNKNKRYMLYRYYTILKSGHLGQGNRRRVHSCVQRLVLDHFPTPVGCDPVGFRPY